ncbi:MAG: membrane lipoprotein lipid attachment site-containing protein [Bacteroidaceae bacterium]|nr:membrane lipoprotein lipid attachment site-containing protein [Bacteroidaceae bacterium]
MKKIFALLSMAIVTGCSINVNDANDDGEYCYLRKLYYSDVIREYPDKYEQWKQESCMDWYGDECVRFDSNAYITVEECTEVYKK